MIHELILRIQQLDRQYTELLSKYLEEISNKKSDKLLRQLADIECKANKIKHQLDNL